MLGLLFAGGKNKNGPKNGPEKGPKNGTRSGPKNGPKNGQKNGPKTCVPDLKLGSRFDAWFLAPDRI